ncbi:hypothetical protein ScPMuIL_016581 [Solemya velum]
MSFIISEVGQSYCNTTWDDVSCWPTTLAGTFATVHCPSGVDQIDVTQNASKFCHENATWEAIADYKHCFPKDDGPVEDQESKFATRVIYNVGFSLSTLTLFIALFIFLYFRSLRCLRNTIHCHLMLTFVLRNLVWILMQHTLVPIINNDEKWACKLEVTLYNYLTCTNFFWMFVEGLYLHIIIVWTYSADKIRLWYLAFIGWGLPVLIIIAWAVVRSHFGDEGDNKHEGCWMYANNSKINYIYEAPILFVLFVNMIFLATIIWVLITKLRASHTLETRQYRKAVKATLILIPLLGLTYVLFITPPSEAPAVKAAFLYVNAFLQSFQGFFVAVFYCFLNGEVKGVLKKRLNRFHETRSLSTRITKTSFAWSHERGSILRESGQAIPLSNGTVDRGNYSSYNYNQSCIVQDPDVKEEEDDEEENVL